MLGESASISFESFKQGRVLITPWGWGAESHLQLQLSSALLGFIQGVVLAYDSRPAMIVISGLIWLPCIHWGELSSARLVANHKGNVASIWWLGACLESRDGVFVCLCVFVCACINDLSV